MAILDDYSDNCSARLPSGEEFTVREIPDDAPTRVLCDLTRAKALKKQLIPRSSSAAEMIVAVEMLMVDYFVPASASVLRQSRSLYASFISAGRKQRPINSTASSSAAICSASTREAAFRGIRQ